MIKTTVGDTIFRVSSEDDHRSRNFNWIHDTNRNVYYNYCGCPGGLVRIEFSSYAKPWVSLNGIEHTEDCEARYIKEEVLKNRREGKLTTP